MPPLRRILNTSLSLTDKLLRRPRLLARPLRIHLEINDCCNLHCIMCGRRTDWIPKNRGEMSLEVVERLRPWFRFANHVGLAGNGEPLLHSHLFEILRIIIEEGAVPSMVTNATLLTEDVIRRLLNYQPLIMVTSIDGARPETFEAIRKGARFEPVIASLRRIKELKEEKHSFFPVINFITCLMKQNLQELPELVRLAHSLDVKLILCQNMLLYNEELKEQMLDDPQQVQRVVEEAKQHAESLGIKFVYNPLGAPQIDWSSVNAHQRLYCPYLWHQLHVGLDGRARFCCLFPEDQGSFSLLEMKPEEFWNHPEFVKLRRSVARGNPPAICRQCSLLSLHRSAPLLQETATELRELIKRRAEHFSIIEI